MMDRSGEPHAVTIFDAPPSADDGRTGRGFDPADPGSYAQVYRERVRYNDLDPLGHVTSQSFVNFFETARVLFFLEVGQPVDDPEFGWMIVRLDTNFLGQLHFPARIDVGTRLLRLGNSSVTTMQGLFFEGSCRATLKSVLVRVDRRKDRPAPIPEDMRNTFRALEDHGRNQGDISS